LPYYYSSGFGEGRKTPGPGLTELYLSPEGTGFGRYSPYFKQEKRYAPSLIEREFGKPVSSKIAKQISKATGGMVRPMITGMMW
jgi:hypothetical protein